MNYNAVGHVVEDVSLLLRHYLQLLFVVKKQFVYPNEYHPKGSRHKKEHDNAQHHYQKQISEENVRQNTQKNTVEKNHDHHKLKLNLEHSWKNVGRCETMTVATANNKYLGFLKIKALTWCNLVIIHQLCESILNSILLYILILESKFVKIV